MLAVEGVSFTYRAGQPDAVPALEDITLTVGGGEMVAIIGPNGSGKSTLLKLLVALLYPTAGQIVIDGIVSDQRTRWDIRRRISVVLQDPDDQLVANRVVDDVAFGPENLGLPREEIAARVHAALRELTLGDAANRLIAELSDGERQRVAIAGALAMRPQVLVLDEPTSNLPVPAARRLLETLRGIRDRSGMSVVHITHVMAEAALFDRVVVLDKGRVALDGTPAEVFQHVDRLRGIGLDVPMTVDVAERLRSDGLPIPAGTTTEASLVDALRVLAQSRTRERTGT